MVEMTQIRQDIIEAINLKLGEENLTCHLCGGVVWTPPNIVTLPEVVFEEGAVFKPVMTGQVVALAVLTCDRCGYTVSMNLVKLGLWQKWEALSQLILPGSVNGKSVA